MKRGFHMLAGVLATAVVAATVVWGFVIVGSPDTRRVERMDERRVEDLRQIHREIQFLVRDPEDPDRLKRPLPSTLEEAAALASQQRLVLTDPETGEPYGYSVQGETVYELTATFVQPRESDRDLFWNHPAGRHTFRIDALDPPGR